MTAAPDLSIVIPVYNEEENLPLLWPEIRDVLGPTGLTYEVIFVDDGSRDRSAEIIRAFREADPRVRLVQLKANAGETAATDAGFKTARGRYVVSMDADLQNDPADIPRLVAKLDEGFDVVSGWRKNRQDKAISRVLPSKIANGIISVGTGVKQLPLHRLVTDDDGVMTGMGGGRDVVRERREEGGAAEFLDLLVAAQCFGNRDEINGLAVIM